ncbi:MAG: T9SS type A sorting domain-containing protein [Bacteroidales bacterium]|nr:T9SS type A sorting domain-containing protein [Bacteroidales bacterium]
MDEEEQSVANLRRANAKDGEGYMPVLTDDSLTFVLASRITYDKTDHDPYYLGAASFGRHIEADLEKDHDPYYLGAASFLYQGNPSDTIVYNNKKYRIFPSPVDELYVREDTLTGRIFRYDPNLDIEVMTCDMSLQEGDTFYLPLISDFWYWELEQREYVVVDSVTYSNGRKVIWFPFVEQGFFSTYPSGTSYPLCFIEGIGPTYGPFGYVIVSYENWLSILLCVHHNDSLIYMTDPVLGCEQRVVSVPEYSDVEMKLYPNPAGDVLHVEFEGLSDPQGTITVTNIMGVVQYVETSQCGVETSHCGVSTNVFSIDVSDLAPGLYVVSFRNGKGVVVRKFVKM